MENCRPDPGFLPGATIHSWSQCLRVLEPETGNRCACRRLHLRLEAPPRRPDPM